MSFLHTELDIGANNTVIVTIDRQANVFLVDDENFRAYRSGRSFRYYGGLQKRSPVRLSPPHSDHWNLVIDLGGAGGSIRHSVRVV